MQFLNPVVFFIAFIGFLNVDYIWADMPPLTDVGEILCNVMHFNPNSPH